MEDFQYYDGMIRNVAEILREGAELILRREPNNLHLSTPKYVTTE